MQMCQKIRRRRRKEESQIGEGVESICLIGDLNAQFDDVKIFEVMGDFGLLRENESRESKLVKKYAKQ